LKFSCRFTYFPLFIYLQNYNSEVKILLITLFTIPEYLIYKCRVENSDNAGFIRNSDKLENKSLICYLNTIGLTIGEGRKDFPIVDFMKDYKKMVKRPIVRGIRPNGGSLQIQ